MNQTRVIGISIISRTFKYITEYMVQILGEDSYLNTFY